MSADLHILVFGRLLSFMAELLPLGFALWLLFFWALPIAAPPPPFHAARGATHVREPAGLVFRRLLSNNTSVIVTQLCRKSHG